MKELGFAVLLILFAGVCVFAVVGIVDTACGYGVSAPVVVTGNPTLVGDRLGVKIRCLYVNGVWIPQAAIKKITVEVDLAKAGPAK